MSTGTIRWMTTLVGGAMIGILAVAAASCENDGPTTAAAGGPTTTPRTTTTPAPTASSPSPSTSPAPTTAPPTTGGAADDDARTITVTGQGRTTVKPDIAHVSMGVRVSGDSAQTVLDEANEKAAALVAALKALGVAADDLATNGISINPRYSPDGSRVTGYEASNNLDVTIRDLSRAGEIIDGGAAFAGEAITISGIWFSVADPEAVMAGARAAAIANAQKRAAEYAGAAGATVGDVVTISEIGVAPPVPMYREFAAADATASVPVEAGTTELTATVTVVFRMK